MRIFGKTSRIEAVLVMLLAPGCVLAQSIASAQLGANGAPRGSEAIREVYDAGTGNRWLLVRDLAQPAGPGRFLLVSGPGKDGMNEVDSKTETQPASSTVSIRPVIRSGDAVLVEESTPTVEMRLEGVALAPARVGAELNVRLKVNGSVVRTVALAQGHVTLATGRGEAR